MIEIHSKALKKSIKINRIIGHHRGSQNGPTLIFTAGVHGNEPSGVFALQRLMDNLDQKSISCSGNIYAISGNLNALEKGIRFSQLDLNRIWTQENIDAMMTDRGQHIPAEIEEQIDLYKTIETILKSESGPFYFFDLHTTSSETVPFITVNDSLLNRAFTKQYPLPIVLGIEEFLHGPMLSYINELGYVAFGFEAGQHDAPVAYENQLSFIYLSLAFTGCVSLSEPSVMKHLQRLRSHTSVAQQFFEIVYHHKVNESSDFKMEPGYVNFQKIKKHEHLAAQSGIPVTAPRSGKIFMPLYQGKGEDGFFIIKKTPKFFLGLSKLLRKVYFDRFLALLPGIKWGTGKREELIVDLKVARFFTKQFFHLLGYRSKQLDATHLRMKNREVASRNDDYKGTSWLK
ncbi:MAG: succinylglutamate desuccinylase/aspartoacylase family protein [Bacteroidota bacterium]